MHGLHDHFNVYYKPLYCSGRHYVASSEVTSLAKMQYPFIEQSVQIFFADKVVSTILKVWQPGGRVLRHIQDRGPQSKVQSISPKNNFWHRNRPKK